MNGNNEVWQFCGTVYRDEAHRNFITNKEETLGRRLTFEELSKADQEWYQLHPISHTSTNEVR